MPVAIVAERDDTLILKPITAARINHARSGA